MDILRTGYIVAVLLAVFTIVEYIFAVEVHAEVPRFLGLAVSSLTKAVLIAWFFMHVPRVWRGEEAH